MKKLIYLSLAVIILSSCNNENETHEEYKEGNGGVLYGGVFKSNETDDFRSLFPLGITEVSADHITKQVYEGLIKQSQEDITILPSLAEQLDFSNDASVWTFYLHKGVKFHDDDCFSGGKGRELTAHDFKYCFDRLCTASPDNQFFGSTFKGRVKGADEYFQSTIDKKPLPGGVSGVEVIDNYTLKITLVQPFAGFLNILSTPGCWVYPKEAYEKYGIEMRTHCVGTGPFKVKSIKEGESVVLERNADYWASDEMGNKLPFLDGIKFSFIKEKKSEFLEFKRGELDMIFQLPVEMISEILGELDEAKEVNAPFEMQVVPAMSTFFFGFQHNSDLFGKKDVRLAFNYAINREKIVDNILQGEGIPGIYGIVPPAFKGYNNKELTGFVYDVEKARKHLAKAGYPNGKGFPKITLQTNAGGDDRDIQVCEAVQKMLKENLNIDVEVDVVPVGEHYERIESSKTLFWKNHWIADYPDPEAFLTLLSGKHIPKSLMDKPYLNSMRYKSDKFDTLFAHAMKELNDRKRMKLYLEADQIGIDDGAVMPVFYDENYRLLKPYVKNFPANAMEYRDLSRVYLDKKKANAKK
jgi:oligopeptide transport system substrate-binding protein